MADHDPLHYLIHAQFPLAEDPGDAVELLIAAAAESLRDDGPKPWSVLPADLYWSDELAAVSVRRTED